MAIPNVYAVDFAASIVAISEERIFGLNQDLGSFDVDNQSLDTEINRLEERGGDPEFRERIAAVLNEKGSKCDAYMRGFRRAFALSRNIGELFGLFHEIKEKIDSIRPRPTGERVIDLTLIHEQLEGAAVRTSLIATRYFYGLQRFFQKLDSAIGLFNRTDPNLSFCAKWFRSWRCHSWPSSFFSPFKHPTPSVQLKFCLAEYRELAEVLERAEYVETREANELFSRDVVAQASVVLASFKQFYRRQQSQSLIRP